MTDTGRPLWQAGACEVADAVAKGTLTCSDAVGAAVDRMRETNGALNAVVLDLGDQAMADAAAADKALADGAPPGPLQGVPITIKVNADQKGLANTNGVTAFKDLIAPADAPVVSNLKKAGAIVIGRTNTPEFSMRATTVNELHGRTYNPWNDWASSGGSSGGASSAVMAGMGAMGHGNDIGGSLRFPAFCTGAASIKPSFQRVPSYNPSAPAERGIMAQTFSVQGPICRSFADVRRSMQALVAYDPQDPWQVPVPFAGPDEGKPKVVLTKNTYGWDLDPAVSDALDTAASALSDAGYEVVETEPPLLEEIASEAIKMMYGETVEMFSDAIAQHGSQECRDLFARIIDTFQIYRGTELAAGMSRRAKYVRAWTMFLADNPLVLSPFLPGRPYAWDRDTQGVEGLREVLEAATFYSFSMNYLGLPAGNVAAGFADGMPVNIQIAGRRFREDQIIDACEVVETRAGRMCERLWS